MTNAIFPHHPPTDGTALQGAPPIFNEFAQAGRNIVTWVQHITILLDTHPHRPWSTTELLDALLPPESRDNPSEIFTARIAIGHGNGLGLIWPHGEHNWVFGPAARLTQTSKASGKAPKP